MERRVEAFIRMETVSGDKKCVGKRWCRYVHVGISPSCVSPYFFELSILKRQWSSPRSVVLINICICCLKVLIVLTEFDAMVQSPTWTSES